MLELNGIVGCTAEIKQLTMATGSSGGGDGGVANVDALEDAARAGQVVYHVIAKGRQRVRAQGLSSSRQSGTRAPNPGFWQVV